MVVHGRRVCYVDRDKGETAMHARSPEECNVLFGRYLRAGISTHSSRCTNPTRVVGHAASQADGTWCFVIDGPYA